MFLLMPALDQTLRDDDLFLIILSGARDGSYRYLPGKLLQVLYEEEHLREKAEPHRLIQGIPFADIDRTPSKRFRDAWWETLESGYVQPTPSSLNGGYTILPSLTRDAVKIKQTSGLSDEDYAYLRGLGERVRLVDT